MIKLLIVDDEREIADLLKKRILNISVLKEKIEIDIYVSAEDALKDLRSGKKAEIILSDIELGGMNGLEFGKCVKRELPGTYLIFLTSYSEFAAKSYTIAAYQYILKTDIDSRLEEVLTDLVNKIYEEEKKYRIIKNANDFVQLKFKDIIYIKKVKGAKYVEYVTAHGIYKERSSLEKIMEELNKAEFVLIERGYIVNIRYIVRLKGNEVYLRNGDKIMVSRARVADVKNKIHACWSA